MSFYYFVASLPSLSLTGPPPIEIEEFRADARRILDPATADEVDVLLGGDLACLKSDFAARWRAAETQLRNALARTRAVQLDLDPTPHQKPYIGFSNYIEQAVVEAFAKSNPLERELSLDRFRWSLLDEWARGEPFGEAMVFAYALKLKMTHRWALLNDETGRAQLEETVKRVRAAVAT